MREVQEGMQIYPSRLGSVDEFGQRITLDMPITGPNGNAAIVRAGWVYDSDSSVSRVMTVYIS